MNKLSFENAYVIARVRNIHRNQLEELAFSEGRTKSSMIRCLIERAYQDFVRRNFTGGYENGKENN
jgi:hypothetical protein